MKIKSFNSIISLCLSLVGTFILYLSNKSEECCKTLMITYGVLFFVSLLFIMVFDFKNKKVSSGTKILSIIFLLIFIISSLLFSLITTFNQNIFIIINAIEILLYALFTNMVFNSSKKNRE